MGCGGSKKKKVYLSDEEEDKSEEELRKKIRTFEVAGKGCPKESINAILVTLGECEIGENITEVELELDPEISGFFSVEAFLTWFQRRSNEKQLEEIHPTVISGQKEDGQLQGPGLAFDVERRESDNGRELSLVEPGTQ
mmetsp:Transcript_48/g.83  ORF Transcript_48/g.83 Transcript_48/m.83 type:complete len:139 (-) Transcript_48:119-535(-)